CQFDLYDESASRLNRPDLRIHWLERRAVYCFLMHLPIVISCQSKRKRESGKREDWRAISAGDRSVAGPWQFGAKVDTMPLGNAVVRSDDCFSPKVRPAVALRLAGRLRQNRRGAPRLISDNQNRS